MTPMQTTSERIEKDRVKLRVEVSEDDLKPAIAGVYRELANEMKVPGFRKGKVPRQIIDSRVGPEFVRSEALKEALPDFYRAALKQEELEAITAPDIEVVEFATGAPIVFEATVDIRPEVVVPDLELIEVEAPDAAVTDEDVDEQMERLRDRFAELETVGRDARRGDFVLIDLKGYEHDELVDGASAPDYLYEVGSRSGPPKLDDELEGNRPGAILKFNDSVAQGELAGRELSFTVLVKEVKAKKLPALDDEFAKTVGEFDTLDELKDDLRERLVDVKRQMVDEEIRTRVLERLIDASELEAPEKLVEAEFDHRLHHLEDDLKGAGMTLAQYAQAADQTELEVRSDLRKSVARSVVAELILEQVAREREITVSEEDLGRDIAVAAARSGQDPSEVAKQLAGSGRLGSVAADIMRRKALDFVVEHVNIENRPADDEPNGG
jgi:trigger factor